MNSKAMNSKAMNSRLFPDPRMHRVTWTPWVVAPQSMVARLGGAMRRQPFPGLTVPVVRLMASVERGLVDGHDVVDVVVHGLTEELLDGSLSFLECVRVTDLRVTEASLRVIPSRRTIRWTVVRDARLWT